MKNTTLGTIVGVVVVIIIIVISIIKFPPGSEDNRFKENNMKIVSIGYQTAPDETKFHNPMVYYLVLLQDTKDSTLLLEVESPANEYYNCKTQDSVIIKTLSDCNLEYKNLNSHNTFGLYCNTDGYKFKWIRKNRL